VLGHGQTVVRVVVAAVDVDVHASDLVDRVDEPAERRRHRVVDVEAVGVGAQQILDRARREVEPPEAVRLVDLRAPPAGDLDREVARDREQRDRARLRVDAQEHDRVRPCVGLAVGVAVVGADEQDRLRLAGRRLGDRARGELDRVTVVLEVVLQVLELEQPCGRHGAAGEDRDEQPREQHPQRQHPRTVSTGLWLHRLKASR
jgi:hypothetical protein